MKSLLNVCGLCLFIFLQAVGQTQKAPAPPAPSKSVSTAGTAQRPDPYKNFRFRVEWNGRTVAGFSKMSSLETAKQTTAQEGRNTASKVPGRTKYDAITLERGVTHDSEFQQWADSAKTAPPANKLKNVVLDVFNEAGQKEVSYIVRRCWVSEFQALPNLDAGANAIAIQHLKLENEGWERQPTGTEKLKLR